MEIKTGFSSMVLAAIATCVLHAGEALSQTQVQNERTIRVSGVGEYRAEPDLATLQFAVETTGSTAQEAAEANADQMEAVIRALEGAGIPRDDIRTSGYALYPVYDTPAREPQTDPPAIRGYRASNQVSVRSRDIEGLGELIDVGIQAGANRLNGVYFELENSAAAEAEALRRAVANARTSAETMAAALGVELGPVLDANTTAEPVRPLYRVADAQFETSMMARAAPTPIEPGEQTIQATATLVFAIE